MSLPGSAADGSLQMMISRSSDVEIDRKMISMVEDESLLFSLALYSPPTGACRADGSVVGASFAREEEYLTLQDRHRRACRLVSIVHRYFPTARFMFHIEADLPERLMRELHEASGWRTRFVCYEIVAKIYTAPVRPGAMPAPHGRPPGVAAAEARRLREKAEADAIAIAAAAQEAAAGGDGMTGGDGGARDLQAASTLLAVGAGAPTLEVSAPKVRGSVVASSLIGATFAQNFGMDGMWEGTVTKFLENKNYKATYYASSGFPAHAAAAATAAATAAAKAAAAIAAAAAASNSARNLSGVKRLRITSPAASTMTAAVAAGGGGPAVSSASQLPGYSATVVGGVKGKAYQGQAVAAHAMADAATAKAADAAAKAAAATAAAATAAVAATAHKSHMAEKKAKIKARKAAEASAAQAAYERAKCARLPPAMANARLAAAAAGVAGAVETDGGAPLENASESKAVEKSGRGCRGAGSGASSLGASAVATPPGAAGRGLKAGARPPPALSLGDEGGGAGASGDGSKKRRRRLTTDEQTAILRHAFWSKIWPPLLAAGWQINHVIQGGRHARYYFPPGVVRGPGTVNRVHFFDSVKLLIFKLRTMPEWKPLMDGILEKAQAGEGLGPGSIIDQLPSPTDPRGAWANGPSANEAGKIPSKGHVRTTTKTKAKSPAAKAKAKLALSGAKSAAGKTPSKASPNSALKSPSAQAKAGKSPAAKALTEKASADKKASAAAKSLGGAAATAASDATPAAASASSGGLVTSPTPRKPPRNRSLSPGTVSPPLRGGRGRGRRASVGTRGRGRSASAGRGRGGERWLTSATSDPVVGALVTIKAEMKRHEERSEAETCSTSEVGVSGGGAEEGGEGKGSNNGNTADQPQSAFPEGSRQWRAERRERALRSGAGSGWSASLSPSHASRRGSGADPGPAPPAPAASADAASVGNEAEAEGAAKVPETESRHATTAAGGQEEAATEKKDGIEVDGVDKAVGEEVGRGERGARRGSGGRGRGGRGIIPEEILTWDKRPSSRKPPRRRTLPAPAAPAARAVATPAMPAGLVVAASATISPAPSNGDTSTEGTAAISQAQAANEQQQVQQQQNVEGGIRDRGAAEDKEEYDGPAEMTEGETERQPQLQGGKRRNNGDDTLKPHDTAASSTTEDGESGGRRFNEERLQEREKTSRCGSNVSTQSLAESSSSTGVVAAGLQTAATALVTPVGDEGPNKDQNTAERRTMEADTEGAHPSSTDAADRGAAAVEGGSGSNDAAAAGTSDSSGQIGSGAQGTRRQEDGNDGGNPTKSGSAASSASNVSDAMEVIERDEDTKKTSRAAVRSQVRLNSGKGKDREDDAEETETDEESGKPEEVTEPDEGGDGRAGQGAAAAAAAAAAAGAVEAAALEERDIPGDAPEYTAHVDAGLIQVDAVTDNQRQGDGSKGSASLPTVNAEGENEAGGVTAAKAAGDGTTSAAVEIGPPTESGMTADRTSAVASSSEMATHPQAPPASLAPPVSNNAQSSPKTSSSPHPRASPLPHAAVTATLVSPDAMDCDPDSALLSPAPISGNHPDKEAGEDAAHPSDSEGGSSLVIGERVSNATVSSGEIAAPASAQGGSQGCGAGEERASDVARLSVSNEGDAAASTPPVPHGFGNPSAPTADASPSLDVGGGQAGSSLGMDPPPGAGAGGVSMQEARHLGRGRRGAAARTPRATSAAATTAATATPSASSGGGCSKVAGAASAAAAAASSTATPSRKSQRRRVESDRARDAKEDAMFIKKQRISSSSSGAAEGDGGSAAAAAAAAAALLAAGSGGGIGSGGSASGGGGGSGAFGTGAVALNPSVRAKPLDLYICRYKDGYEENLSLEKLRQLGAAFKHPNAGLATTPFRGARPIGVGRASSGGGGGGGSSGVQDHGDALRGNDGGAGGNATSGGGEDGPGGGKRWKAAAKPGSQRLLGAMSMAPLWTHKGRETVVTASINDDARLLVREVVRLLMQMKEESREVGITFWESPERKCLNECHLPLPPLLQAPAAAGHEGTAAAMSSVASASTATAASGVGDGDGGHQAPAEGGEKPDGNSGGVGAADAGRSGQVGIALGGAPGGWKDPRHGHSGALVIWKAGQARTRAKGKGEFQEHCCSALLGSTHVPPGAETMLLDGFLNGTEILEKYACYRPYERRPWPADFNEGHSAGDTLPTPATTKVAPGTTRLSWKKVVLQVGKVARKPEAIYVCSSRKAAIAAAETEAAATSSSLVPSARSNTPTSCPSSAQGEDRAAIGTAPWVSLSTLTAPSNAQGHAQGSPAPGAQGATHHFQACVVCQRMGSGKSLTTTSHTSTSHNGATSPNSTETPGAGPLLLCSTCPAAFHLPCLRPRLRAMPKKGKGGSKWSCAYCYATGRRWGGDSDGACGAVRLMESLRQSMQGSIRVNTMRTLRYNAIG